MGIIEILRLMREPLEPYWKNAFQKSLIECLNYHASLDLSYQNLSTEDIQNLFSVLKNNNTVKYLDLRANNIGPEAISIIVEALKHNSILKGLDLRFNHLKDEDAINVSSLLESALTDLDVRYNKMNAQGIKAVAQEIATANLLPNRKHWFLKEPQDQSSEIHQIFQEAAKKAQKPFIRMHRITQHLVSTPGLNPVPRTVNKRWS